MRIAFVELAGFRGFKEKLRFDFPAGFVVLTGRNGAGKSTVLDAVDYALTGTIDKFAEKRAKGGGLDSHIWWVGDGRAQEHYVKVGFCDRSGTEFEITRNRDRGLEPPLKELSSLLCKGDLAEDWPRTLMQTTLIRDETLASLSMDLPEQARFEAVRAAIGGLTGPDHSARTAELVSAAKVAKQNQDEKLSELQSDLGRALSALTEARAATERQADIAKAEQTIRQLAPDLDAVSSDISEKLRKRIADRKQEAKTILEIIEALEEIEVEANFFASADGRGALQSAQEVAEKTELDFNRAKSEYDGAIEVASAERDADQFASHMISLLTHGEHIGLIEGHCPLCDAARADAEFVAAIEQAKTRLSERGRAAALIQERVASAKEYLEVAGVAYTQASLILEDLRRRELRAKEGFESISNRLKQFDLVSFVANPTMLRDAALKRQEQTATLEYALFVLESSGAHDRVVALESRVEQLRKAIDAENIKAAQTERALEAARQIDGAAKTIANQILTEQFDTVMPLLKELYLRLRPHTDWREIETDFGGKIRASLNFTVGEGRNPQFLFSSGQRRAAGMAFLLAIHLSRPWSQLQTLLLDDPVQHIDDYRALNLVEVLSAVRRMGRQVIVAVEDAALADLLCRRLRSSASEGGLRYDLAMGSNGSATIERQIQISPLPISVLDFAQAS